MLNSWADWVAWGGLVIPLFAIAFSAVQYVRMELEKARSRRYDRFFELMEQLGKKDYSIAAKMAAAHELKKFPEYKEVVLRLMVDAKIGGTEAWLLEREFDLTAKHFGHNGRND